MLKIYGTREGRKYKRPDDNMKKNGTHKKQPLVGGVAEHGEK